MASFLELNDGKKIVLQDNKILDNFGNLRWNISAFTENKNRTGRNNRYRALCEMFTMLRESKKIVYFQKCIERSAYQTFRNELIELHNAHGLSKQPANFFDTSHPSVLNIGFVTLSVDKRNLYIDEHFDSRLCGDLTNYCFYKREGTKVSPISVPTFILRNRILTTPLDRVSSLVIDFTENKLILNGTIEWKINNLIYRDKATGDLCSRLLVL